jgi:hypothetical protein
MVLAAQAADLHEALERAEAEGLPHVILDGKIIPADRCREKTITLADPGYDDADIGIHIPVRQPADGRELDIDTRTRNALQRSLRCLGERGFALLTQRWRTLQHITASPSRIGDIAAPLSSSPISSTATPHQFAEISSLRAYPDYRGVPPPCCAAELPACYR